MSIRLRFTLLYNAILALTLLVFGISLYTIQSQNTLEALKKEMRRSSETLSNSMLRVNSNPPPPVQGIPRDPYTPMLFESFSDDQAFQKLPEREIVRILDASGNLVVSPFGRGEDALPLSTAGLTAAQNGQDWWETAQVEDRNLLIYSRPILRGGTQTAAPGTTSEVAYILQIARPLSEREQSLRALSSTLLGASLVTLAIAFGIGWVLSGITLRPIHRITHTAQTIGAERDFTRRVTYHGPQDEVGRLAITLNGMLAQLQDAYQRVAHSLEMQRNFVADVSHELRTPLTTLRGNLGLLRRKPPIPDEEETDILQDMVDESDRLIRLVNDLLIMARAETGRGLEREPIQLQPLLEEILRQAQQLDPERSISVNIEPDLTVLGDRDALKQVALILLDNAIKHTDAPIEMSAHTDGDCAKISVQDHGVGIPADKLEHVFDRFYRGEESLEAPGFGLGLPIAKALVESMGGTITIQSEIEQGSLITVRFPKA